jgi:hypothetical protein
MKPTTLLFAGLLLTLFACKNPKPDLSVKVDGTDTASLDTTRDMDKADVVEYDSATMMKAWQDFMTPGDMHKWLAKWDGTWTGEVTSYMGAEGQPSKSTATMTNKMIMNGLYQMSDYSGTMMGQPFQGHGILAYDNAKKEFVNTWIDNMGSGVLVMRGSLDTTNNVLSIKGTQTDPVTGKDAMIREEVRFIDDNTHSFTMWGEMNGKEHKFMDATFKRKM